MILLKNGNIYTMNNEIYENGDILVEDKKIIQVGEKIKVNKPCKIVDLKGAFVLPGLIDAHTHLGIYMQDIGLEGVELNEYSEPITPHLRAIDGINPFDSAFDDAIKNGITTVCSGPGSSNLIAGEFAIIKTYGKVIDKMIIKENAAIKLALGENPKRNFKGKNKMPATRMGMAALVRETLVKTENYIYRKEKAEAKKEYFEKDIKLEALIPVIKKSVPLKVHAHRSDDIITAIRIAKEFDINITLDHCTEGHLIAEEIKDSKFPAIVGPSLSQRSKIELKNKTFATYKALYDKKVKLAITTDHPMVPIENLPICAALAVKAGLPMEEGLKAITINAAEILGVSNLIGSIEAGKIANIAVFDSNPLTSYAKCIYTIIDGDIVYSESSIDNTTY
ncbi:MAG: amidohydrolase [Clostridiaceae bacterium]